MGANVLFVLVFCGIYTLDLETLHIFHALIPLDFQVFLCFVTDTISSPRDFRDLTASDYRISTVFDDGFSET